MFLSAGTACSLQMTPTRKKTAARKKKTNQAATPSLREVVTKKVKAANSKAKAGTSQGKSKAKINKTNVYMSSKYFSF